MLPYPSGEPHVGHLKNYSIGDAIAHFRRRNGFEVIHPMGYDAFGLPAENNAIKTGVHPRVATERSIASYRQQFKRWGVSLDWSREVATHTPRVLPLDPMDLSAAARAGPRLPRGGAPSSGARSTRPCSPTSRWSTGHCERCGALVEQRRLEQWFFRITAYADRLLADFELLGKWPEHVVTMQRNWIGRSEGARVSFRCEELELDFPVFTTRPDTLFGASFLRRRSGAPVGLAAGRGNRARGGGGVLRRPAPPAPRPPSAAPRIARRPAWRPAARSPTPSTVSRSPSGSPITC